jgi:excisionase family DNA binding protein
VHDHRGAATDLAAVIINRFTPITDLPELLRVDEAAAVLDVSRWLVYELIRRGDLPSVKLGRLVRIPRTALEVRMQQRDGARGAV